MSAFWERFRKNPRDWIIIVVGLIHCGLFSWVAYLRYVEGRDWADQLSSFSVQTINPKFITINIRSNWQANQLNLDLEM